jgi:hypothetical protein
MRQYWIVHRRKQENFGRHNFAVHESLKSALDEAKRLAGEHRDRFVVLQVVAAYEPADVRDVPILEASQCNSHD